jgi:protein-tyrosine phosphatase
VGEPFFVDVHSHVVPSGDDGVRTMDEGLALCHEASRRGTRTLFATPHVWPHLVLTEEREQLVRERFAAMAPNAGLDLRLGFELTPMPSLLDADPWRYALEGLDAVLVEVPFVGRADILVAVAEHIEAAGLLPVIAHPERSEALFDDPGLADLLVERGWLLQLNSTSLLGRHGPEVTELGWRLVDRGQAALVGSDGHRDTRPPYLDDVYAAVAARVGETRARSLFDGSALAAVSSRRPASRAAARGA